MLYYKEIESITLMLFIFTMYFFRELIYLDERKALKEALKFLRFMILIVILSMLPTLLSFFA